MRPSLLALGIHLNTFPSPQAINASATGSVSPVFCQPLGGHTCPQLIRWMASLLVCKLSAAVTYVLTHSPQQQPLSCATGCALVSATSVATMRTQWHWHVLDPKLKWCFDWLVSFCLICQLNSLPSPSWATVYWNNAIVLVCCLCPVQLGYMVVPIMPVGHFTFEVVVLALGRSALSWSAADSLHLALVMLYSCSSLIHTFVVVFAQPTNSKYTYVLLFSVLPHPLCSPVPAYVPCSALSYVFVCVCVVVCGYT